MGHGLASRVEWRNAASWHRHLPGKAEQPTAPAAALQVLRAGGAGLAWRVSLRVAPPNCGCLRLAVASAPPHSCAPRPSCRSKLGAAHRRSTNLLPLVSSRFGQITAPAPSPSCRTARCAGTARNSILGEQRSPCPGLAPRSRRADELPNRNCTPSPDERRQPCGRQVERRGGRVLAPG